MRFKHVLTGLMALFSGAMAAAPAPLARWSGDFTQTVKGDFTLNACGNMVALDGSSITIVPTAASGVTIDYPASKGILTVVVRYSNYSIPAADTAFLTFWGNGQNDINLSTNCNRCGFLVRSSGNAAPIWNGALWYNATSGQEQSFPSSSEGYVAYCYNLASPKKGCLFVADWATDWSLVVDKLCLKQVEIRFLFISVHSVCSWVVDNFPLGWWARTSGLICAASTALPAIS